MKLSRKHRREERQHKLRSREAELNIVSLIDVFAVLVFFLLVSSSVASSRLHVIGLNLPSPDTAPPVQDQRPFALTIVLRHDGLEVSSRDNEPRPFAKTPAGYPIEALANTLIEVKKSRPREQDLTLLVESDIAYEDVVKVMDAARLAPAEARAQGLPKEMFPNISIGDAPKLAVQTGATP